ncbi:hypothetical protein [Fodinicola feengrottensis]|uniref:hypothetical protein n=1 Tax=Fodinicola feengrottensis TaxID=435914 RepID=UPI0031E20535
MSTARIRTAWSAPREVSAPIPAPIAGTPKTTAASNQNSFLVAESPLVRTS